MIVAVSVGVGWPAVLPLASLFPNDVVPDPGHESEVLNQNTQVCPMQCHQVGKQVENQNTRVQ